MYVLFTLAQMRKLAKKIILPEKLSKLKIGASNNIQDLRSPLRKKSIETYHFSSPDIEIYFV